MAIKKTRYFLFFLTASFFTNLVNAQKAPAPSESTSANFYVKVYGGYGLLTPGSFKGYGSTNSNGSASSFKTPSTGLGAGLHFGGGIGVILNDFLNVGVDAEYLKGSDIKSNSIYTDNATYYYRSDNTIKQSVLSIIPNVTFKALSEPSYYFYTRLGIVIAVNTDIKTVEYDSSYNNPNYNVTHANGKYTTKLSFGAEAAFGVQFTLSGNLRGFGEIVGFYLPSSPSSYNYTSTNVSNGVTQPSNNYVYNYMSSGAYSSTGPTYNLPKITNNINYIGLNIGVSYKF